MRTQRFVINGGTATVTHNPDWSGDAVVRWTDTVHRCPREVAIPGEIFLAVLKTATVGVRESLKICIEHLGGDS